MVVTVVTPLNSIMQDQVVSLTEKGVEACYLDISGSSATGYNIFPGHQKHDSDSSDSSDQDEEQPVFTEKSVCLTGLQQGEYVLIYSHPEALVSNTKMAKILRSTAFRTKVGRIFVDEVHMISEWGKEFRTALMKLSDINALFESAVHVAVTATLTPSAVKKLSEQLQLKNPTVLQMNPDRPNICIEIKTRLPNIYKWDKYDDLIQPLCTELKKAKSAMPVTVVYVDNLDCLWYAYQFLEKKMDNKAFLPGKPQTPENRIFAMYHKDYTPQMKAFIIQDLRKESPVIRLIFATVALGMGLNAPAISRVVHFRPPTDMEKYMQEIGRAGRQGQPSMVIMYYNNSDLAKNRPGITDEISKLCRNRSTCLSKELLEHFVFTCNSVLHEGNPAGCCSNCKMDNNRVMEQEITASFVSSPGGV